MKEKQATWLQLGEGWEKVLADELSKPYMKELEAFIEREIASGQKIYPPKELIFNAFRQTPFESVQVVIMGQDPYHGARQAHGLSFSVPEGVPPPPSLQNIFKELSEDLHLPRPKQGCLLSWAQQGVLLLNATLTVRAGQPKSHYGKGWERFTDAVVTKLVEREDPLIFVLWGKSAQEKIRHILQSGKPSRHYVLASAHPSPYSAESGFFGCRHFSKINTLLIQQGKRPIDWSVGC